MVCGFGPCAPDLKVGGSNPVNDRMIPLLGPSSSKLLIDNLDQAFSFGYCFGQMNKCK